MSKDQHLWVVEIRFAERKAWMATTGVAFTRTIGRENLKRDWQRNDSPDQFRLTKYVPAGKGKV